MDGVSTQIQARRIELTGYVQGVGFRPFVYRLAHRHGVTGWVQNQLGQVALLAQGPATVLDEFARALVDQAPPLAAPRIVTDELVAPTTLGEFCIRPSTAGAEAHVFVPADQFACSQCLAEITDPRERRYRYPFTNCTNCGPRYTLITALPYDRANTTMAGFPLCAACRKEYADPLDRRFHAEPIACPDCGPALSYRDGQRQIERDSAAALRATGEALTAGRVVAVKGVGGYHLMCAAGSDAAVARLRAAKGRPAKPLAVMFPPAGADQLAAVGAAVALSPEEAAAIASPLRPIVLARRRNGCALSEQLAPGLAELGVFLPYSPLHQLILSDFGAPLVATSGNLSGEPVLTDNEEADRRLNLIADAFLHHDRPIQRPADDSVLRSSAGRPRPLRLGRGAAPLELRLPASVDEPVLALGGHMKGSIALAWAQRLVMSPHIGEMGAPRSLRVMERLVADLQALYGVTARRLICDAHPGYSTHRWARRSGLPITTVPHHVAHASALAGEHNHPDPMLVFTWDGVGLGPDGALWGGETFLGEPGAWRRVASMRPFHLPGGERAGREPWRSAAALCWATERDCPVGPADARLVHQAWQRRLNSPATSAVGRLFDAASALILGIESVSYEGQGPMQLEALAAAGAEAVPLPISTAEGGLKRVDWGPLLDLLLDAERPARERASVFHASLAHNILAQARQFRAEHGVNRVGLTGGVFQNRLLVDTTAELLGLEGFTLLLTERVPCNDGGLCFGQVIEAVARAHP
jgi:hydrogenase maturation protein HypF